MKYSINLILIFLAFAKSDSSVKWLTASDGNRYYINLDGSYTMGQALEMCNENSLQLVEIESSSKNDALVSVLRKALENSTNLWIGAREISNNTVSNGKFVWISNDKEITFTHWAAHEPNNLGREHCVAFWEHSDFKWNNWPCNWRCGFICEEIPVLSTTTTTTEVNSIETEAQTSSILETSNAPHKNCEANNSNQIKEIARIEKKLRESIEKIDLETEAKIHEVLKNKIKEIIAITKEKNQLILYINSNSTNHMTIDCSKYIHETESNQLLLCNFKSSSSSSETSSNERIADIQQQLLQSMQHIHDTSVFKINQLKSEQQSSIAKLASDNDKIISEIMS